MLRALAAAIAMLTLVVPTSCSSPADDADARADASDTALVDAPGDPGADTARPDVPDAPPADAADVEPADLPADSPPEQADTPSDTPPDVQPPECTSDATCAPGVCDLMRCWPAPATMQPVPAGPFWMGCDATRDAQCEGNGLGGFFDQPYHQVTTGAYQIDTFETTVAEYAHCVAAGACTLPELAAECTWSAGEKSTLPITCVTWDQANAYCAWRGARLCTESEWEKAARGGCETLPLEQQADCAAHQRLNPWGDEAATCAVAVMSETGTTEDAGCGTGWPMAVGSKPDGASPYGVHDTVGNVAEWLADCFEASYDGAPVDGSARTECVWPDGDWLSGQYRVTRAGDWLKPPWFQRGAQRGADAPMGTYTVVGIRCCQP